MPKRKREQQLASDEEGGNIAGATDRPRVRGLHTLTTPYVSDDSSDVASEDDACHPARKVVRRELSHVNAYGPAFPRSVYQGWRPPHERTEEIIAVSQLKQVLDRHHTQADEAPDYAYFVLDDFSIYRPDHRRHAYELCTLDRLQNRDGFKELLFDGILSVKGERRFVQGVRFNTMAIEGYGDREETDLRGHICIQTSFGEEEDVWYKLGCPSNGYKRFYEPFLWLAQFTKYFVDYALENDNMTLGRFRSQFYTWLCSRHRNQPSFDAWLNKCGHLQDFRTVVAAHVGFLWKECWSIDDDKTGLCKHPIWHEVDPQRLNAICEQPNREKRTIVTRFTHECFKDMYFSDHLEIRSVSDPKTLGKITRRKIALGLTPFRVDRSPNATMPTPQSLPDSNSPFNVVEGDVVSVKPSLNSQWKTAATSRLWYAYVLAIRAYADYTTLDVLWLYQPQDTTMGNAYYPFANELFLSDHCDCGKDGPDITSVIGKADVTWFVTDPESVSPEALFVRQKYRTVHDQDTYDFVTLRDTDFRCHCPADVSIFEECRQTYQIGDTVLVVERDASMDEMILEPAQIVDFNLDTKRVIVRLFQRKAKFDRNSPSNELVWSKGSVSKASSKIIRKCHVRIFETHDMKCGNGLPTPYDCDGTGDHFFILGQRSDSDPASSEVVDCDETDEPLDGGVLTPYPLIEGGWDPTTRTARLVGMGIFCGGGNFDRGLEEGGAVKFQYAIDWAKHALHSYKANVVTPNKAQYFLGSVNDYLAQAMAGSKAACMAKPGSIDLISAGSPCPGFSMLQPNRQSDDSLRNASMVASVVSFVDIYSPRYLIHENVVTMTSGMGANKDQNVFAQILAALVALGYQVQQFLMDAWSFGSAQSRSRVFIIASAPGLAPLVAPPYSHAHPDSTVVTQRSLGKSSNGCRFGMRRDDYTPFQHVSAASITADLPNIGDSLPQLCPEFPDHRTASDESVDSRTRIEMIPVHPRGSGLLQAVRFGRITAGEPMQFFNSFKRDSIRRKGNSKTYSRVYPDGQFKTVTTALRLQCGIEGRSLHWAQHRALTVMELRRAQGFLDHEVIIGTPAEQVKIIGNSVDRKVALVLGLALRESWLKSIEGRAFATSTAQSFAELIIAKEVPQARLDGKSQDLFVLSQEEKDSLLAERRVLETGHNDIDDDNTAGDETQSMPDAVRLESEPPAMAPVRQNSPAHLLAGLEPHEDDTVGPTGHITDVGSIVGETRPMSYTAPGCDAVHSSSAYVQITVEA